jgi:AbrB family looped-hinge helix DNA binding protein
MGKTLNVNMLKVRISSKGQVVLPKAVREQLHLEEGTELSLLVEHGAVILRKASRRDWRRWSGRFLGGGMLEALERDHQEEVARDA